MSRIDSQLFPPGLTEAHQDFECRLHDHGTDIPVEHSVFIGIEKEILLVKQFQRLPRHAQDDVIGINMPDLIGRNVEKRELVAEGIAQLMAFRKSQ